MAFLIQNCCCCSSTSIFLLFISFSVFCNSFKIISPETLQGDYYATVYHSKYGRQDYEGFNITGYVTAVQAVLACDPFHKLRYKNKIVFFGGERGRSIAKDFIEAAECIEDGGALAAILVMPIETVGFYYRFDDFGDIRNISSNFLLVTSKNDVTPIINAIMAFTPILMELTIDSNKWVEMWDSVDFFIVFKVVMPIINGIGIIMAIKAIMYHLIKSNATKNSTSDTKRLIIGALLFILAGLVIRFSYCLIGPIMSTSSLTGIEHVALMTITIPIQLMVTIISTILFLKWGAFGTLTEKAVGRIEISLLSVGILAFLLRIAGVYTQFYDRTRDTMITTVNSSITLIVFVFSALAFFTYGIRFVRLLSTHVDKKRKTLSSKEKFIKKAVIWIIISGFFQLMEISFGAMLLKSEFIWTPNGWFISWTVGFLSLSLDAITCVQAFSPRGEGLTSQVKNLSTFKSKKSTFTPNRPCAFFVEDELPGAHSGQTRQTL
eukprot:c20781_g1_i1.p1 GENE.c20781_g1_i1~~c20781_g1_i1.p1  ORF type:complete len:492 (-),score=146.18 c20781_g1_i1:170-1645(-)